MQIQEWLHNLGFTLVFVSLILKTFRINVIFASDKQDINAAKSLSDMVLMKFLALALVGMTGLLVAWTVIEPTLESTKYLSDIAAVDRCSMGTFQVITIFVRIAVELLAAKMASDGRKAPR